jgi:hypothetical protein
VTQVEYTMRMIELGYFDFFGLGTSLADAERALEAAARIDAGSPAEDIRPAETGA